MRRPQGCLRLPTHGPDPSWPGLPVWLSFPELNKMVSSASGTTQSGSHGWRLLWKHLGFFGQGALLSFLRRHFHRLYRLLRAGRSPLIPHNLTLCWNSQGGGEGSLQSIPVPCSRDFPLISSLPAPSQGRKSKSKTKNIFTKSGKVA